MLLPPPPLIGTYAVPRVRKCQRVTCLFRDGECVVIGVQDAPLPWPRCRRIGFRGGSGLWVNEDLVRAIRAESSEALQHWFGVGGETVWRWRKVFGVTQWGTPGSKELHAGTCAKGAVGIKAKEWTDEERRAKSRRAKRLGLKPPGRATWTPAMDALLGKASDKVAAHRLGKTPSAVRCRRHRLGLPPHARRP